MAIVERGAAFYVKVHRGRGHYEHVGTFRWDEHGGKRAARRAAETAEAEAHERRRTRKSVETCDEFAARWTDDYPIVKHGPTRGQRKSDKTLRGYRDELKPFVREFRGIRLADVDRPTARGTRMPIRARRWWYATCSPPAGAGAWPIAASDDHRGGVARPRRRGVDGARIGLRSGVPLVHPRDRVHRVPAQRGSEPRASRSTSARPRSRPTGDEVSVAGRTAEGCCCRRTR